MTDFARGCGAAPGAARARKTREVVHPQPQETHRPRMENLTAVQGMRWVREGHGFSNQLRHGLPAVHEVLRAAGEVVDGGFVRVNAHELVEAGEDLAEMHGALGGARPRGGRWRR